MSTNFPSSVDAFTNPTSNDTLDNPPHDQQHADINDAMEAVQTSLLDGSPLKIDDANNRVGIGTASPSTTLHVDGSILANDSVTIGDGGEYVAGSIYSDANWGMIFRAKQASPAQADFRWANSADTERMRIDSSGNVGINDSTPSYKLDVNGDINTTGKYRVDGDVSGGVVQHFQTGIGTAVGSTSSTYAATGMSITHTAKAAGNLLIFDFYVPCSKDAGNTWCSLGFQLRRDSTAIWSTNGFLYTGSATVFMGVWTRTYWYSAPDTNQHTYSLYFANHPYNSGGTVAVAATASAGYQGAVMNLTEVLR